MKSRWILVADSSRARIFTVEKASAPLEEMEVLVNPEGREHEQEISSDLPGRDSDRNGSGRHAFQDETEPKEQEILNFAKRIAQHVDKARTTGKLNQLIIIAAPAFLGTLRNQLSEQSRKLISLTLDKNLTQHDPVDIRKHLPKLLPSV